MSVIAGVDLGNAVVKAVVGDLDKRYEIDNVIARMGRERSVLEYEHSLWDGLHVEIVSGALKQSPGVFAVGNLAKMTNNSTEVLPHDDKSESDQVVIMLLTVLAVHTVLNGEPNEEGVYRAQFDLCVGLPINESKKEARQRMRDKLKNNIHQVTFLDTPEIGGRKVILEFPEVLVAIEGRAAALDLMTNDDGSIRNEELAKSHLLLVDVGGNTTDCPVIRPDGIVDNVASEGVQIGVSPYLDRIMRAVEREYDYRFKSRKHLVECITHPNADERYHIFVRGVRQNIQPIVEEQLQDLAEKVYRQIKRMWDENSEIRYCYVIGGGAVLIRKYLEAINQQDRNYVIRFVDPEISAWLNARGFFKTMQVYLAQKVSS